MIIPAPFDPALARAAILWPTAAPKAPSPEDLCCAIGSAQRGKQHTHMEAPN
jgi:hypothetical protein